MVREFELPDVGEGLTEAEIVRWLVEPGDTVSEDMPVAEVETDKAVVEVPAPVDGTVKELLAEEGEMAAVGDVIITFDLEGEASEAAGEAGAESETTAGADAGAEGDTADAADADEAPEPADGRVFAAPSARRLARELGVDITAVDGSGPGGRVTDTDVRAAAESDTGDTDETDDVTPATQRVSEEQTAAETPTDSNGTTSAAVESADREQTLAAPATRKLAEEEGIDLDAVPTDDRKDGEAFVTEAHVTEYAEAQQAAQAADAEAVSAGADAGTTADAPAGGPEITGGEDERIPYRGVRKTIGQQMERSKYTAPHVTHHDEIDVTRLVETRGRLKERAEERGTKLTYMPFVMKAIIAGLKEHPILNSQLDEDNEEIVLRGDYNIGIATATDAGLMVPVLEHADQKGMLTIADEMRGLINRARDRSISPDEMQGGTFTITNFGAIGGEFATPIINYPETGILGLGAIKDKPRVVDGEVVPRKVMTVSLSIDHRVIDGADAAQFVNTVKEYLESPELLLLE